MKKLLLLLLTQCISKIESKSQLNQYNANGKKGCYRPIGFQRLKANHNFIFTVVDKNKVVVDPLYFKDRTCLPPCRSKVLPGNYMKIECAS